MLTKKKKLSKKEIKEDKLVTTYFKTVKFVDQNKSKILIYAASLIVVIGLVVFYMWNKSGQNEKANVALSRVINLYDAGAYQEAIDGVSAQKVEGLKAIVDKYGSTENGEIAKIYLANCYNFLGKFDEAYKYYDDYSGSNKEFKAAAKAGEGSYYEAKKEYEDAADAFKDASSIQKNNPLNAEYLFKAGINYMDAGKKTEAAELFKKVKDEYKTSPYARNVERYLAVIE